MQEIQQERQQQGEGEREESVAKREGSKNSKIMLQPEQPPPHDLTVGAGLNHNPDEQAVAERCGEGATADEGDGGDRDGSWQVVKSKGKGPTTSPKQVRQHSYLQLAHETEPPIDANMYAPLAGIKTKRVNSPMYYPAKPRQAPRLTEQ